MHERCHEGGRRRSARIRERTRPILPVRNCGGAPVRGPSRRRAEVLRRRIALVTSRNRIQGSAYPVVPSTHPARSWRGSTRRRSSSRSRRPARRPGQSAAPGRRGGQRLPSTMTCAGRQPSPSSARRIASSVACRMLIASISQGSATADRPQAMLRSRMRGEFLAHLGSSALESAMPSIGRRRSRMTALATTGPASGPRPASSTPGESDAAQVQRRLPGMRPPHASRARRPHRSRMASRRARVRPGAAICTRKRPAASRRVAGARAVRAAQAPSASGCTASWKNSGTTRRRPASSAARRAHLDESQAAQQPARERRRPCRPRPSAA
jgi:hypothetical protein